MGFWVWSLGFRGVYNNGALDSSGVGALGLDLLGIRAAGLSRLVFRVWGSVVGARQGK